MPIKTPTEKLRTKIDRLLQNEHIIENEGQILVKEETLLFSFNDESIIYSRNRYYPTKKEEIAVEDFDVSFALSHETLELLSANISNPPKRARQIMELFRSITETEYDSLNIGLEANEIRGNAIFITKELYEYLSNIDKEEAANKKKRFTARIAPTLNNEFELEIGTEDENYDPSLILREVIERGDISQQDIKTLSEQLEVGPNNKIVISSRIDKQVGWLIDTIESILELDSLTQQEAKDIGFEKFGYTKVSITGQEHLMEKILTDYGQNTLFGAPALLNTNKYVVYPGLPRSQFDLVLVDHLGEIEIVELKRPDKHLLDFDPGRNKFYPSVDLAVAIAQTERYISAVYNKNDEGQQINGQTLKEFIDDQIGDTLSIQSVRPRGIIIMGSYQKLCRPHRYLHIDVRNRISEADYNNNCEQAYKEIKDSFKNLKIITYSELLESARTRLNINRTDEEE